MLYPAELRAPRNLFRFHASAQASARDVIRQLIVAPRLGASRLAPAAPSRCGCTAGSGPGTARASHDRARQDARGRLVSPPHLRVRALPEATRSSACSPRHARAPRPTSLRSIAHAHPAPGRARTERRGGRLAALTRCFTRPSMTCCARGGFTCGVAPGPPARIGFCRTMGGRSNCLPACGQKTRWAKFAPKRKRNYEDEYEARLARKGKVSGGVLKRRAARR